MSTEERLERIERLLLISSKEVLTTSECALMLDISESRLRHLTSEKEIPHYKNGRNLYFKKSEIEQWQTKYKVLTKDEINAQASTYIVQK